MKLQNNLKLKVSKAPNDDTFRREISFVDLKRQRQALELQGYKNEIDARGWLVAATFITTVLWLAAVLIIFYNYGLGELHFPERVVITFLTTTTANTLAFLTIVFRYLFSERSRCAPRSV